MIHVPTIEEILAEFRLPEDVKATLRLQLYAREDAMKEVMQLAGVQFGLFAEIVAEVLAEVGLGTPMPEDQRALIRLQYVALIERLTEEHGH